MARAGRAASIPATVRSSNKELAKTSSDRAFSVPRTISKPAVVQPTHKRASVNGVNLHYVTVGNGPAVVCLHGWPQNHREFVPFFETCSNSYRFIAPDLRGYADSDKPYADYLPATIAQNMLELADVERADRFHILSHDLGDPPSVALAYMARERALSLATIETPFFGLPRLYRPAGTLLASRHARQHGYRTLPH
jgi:pimeloyl-ACP methyl ester carboxylesterase